MHCLSQDEFLKLSTQGNLIPVYKEIMGDLETPVSAYYKLAEKSKYSFLLESVEGGEKFARFSFIARDPQLILRSKGKKAEILRLAKGKIKKETKTFKHSPLEIVRDLMSGYTAVQMPQLPRFYGGMVGYLSYDCVRFFERLPDKNKDEMRMLYAKLNPAELKRQITRLQNKLIDHAAKKKDPHRGVARYGSAKEKQL